MAYPTKTFPCVVDAYRNGFVFRAAKDRLYERNTQGRYLVGAKSKKQARQILQKAIGFGSIDVHEPETNPTKGETCLQGEIKRLKLVNKNGVLTYVTTNQIAYATDPVEREE